VVYFLRSQKELGSVGQALKKAFNHAEQKNYERIFLAWDPLTHPIVHKVLDQSKKIIGIGKLSRGEGINPLWIIEVANKAEKIAKAKAASISRPVLRQKIKSFIKDESGSVKLCLDPEEWKTRFTNLGYAFRPGKGSHTVGFKTDYPNVTLPNHSELAKGTAGSISHTYNEALARYIHSQVETQSKANPISFEKRKKFQGPTLDQPFAHRIDYTEDYAKAQADFIKVHEFNGVLSKDLMVIQYHSSEPLHQNRTHKWFMPVAEGTKHPTIEGIQDAVAKLSAFGEITEVTLARIPAGEPVRFMHGKAVQKIDALTGEVRSGGGVQYRFFDFDLNWIVLSKPLT
jgi:hypothetical protein